MSETTGNPWGITARQAEAMALLAETGSAKVAADRMGVSSKTVDGMAGKAANKMGARTRIQAIVLWDRAQRPSRGLESATAAELAQVLAEKLRVEG